MTSVLTSLLATLGGVVRSRAALHLEILALRHQLPVLQRSQPRRLRLAVIVKPQTVVAWHRKGFRLFWTWTSRRRTGRPPVSADARALIRKMAHEHPLWGAPRIHGELLKLGVPVSQGTVAK
jgi:putative transposase